MNVVDFYRAIKFEKIDDKTWKSGWLKFKDLGHIENGITHKFEVVTEPDIFTYNVLGWIEWKSGWRKYTFRPTVAVSTWYDESCLTTIAAFVRMRTEERKSTWSKQGRFPDR